jgi:hypothetical protein
MRQIYYSPGAWTLPRSTAKDQRTAPSVKSVVKLSDSKTTDYAEYTDKARSFDPLDPPDHRRPSLGDPKPAVNSRSWVERKKSPMPSRAPSGSDSPTNVNALLGLRCTGWFGDYGLIFDPLLRVTTRGTSLLVVRRNPPPPRRRVGARDPGEREPPERGKLPAPGGHPACA